MLSVFSSTYICQQAVSLIKKNPKQGYGCQINIAVQFSTLQLAHLLQSAGTCQQPQPAPTIVLI